MTARPSPWKDDRTVGTVNITAVNVNDLLNILVSYTLRYGVALDVYIDGNNLVFFAPAGENDRPLPLEHRLIIGLDLTQHILGRVKP
jgi:hypothetical protein